MLTFLAGVAFLALGLTATPLDLVAAFFLGAAFLAAAGAAAPSSAVASALGLAAAFFVAVFLAAGLAFVAVFLGAYKEELVQTGVHLFKRVKAKWKSNSRVDHYTDSSLSERTKLTAFFLGAFLRASPSL